jgi:hypothetical protein
VQHARAPRTRREPPKVKPTGTQERLSTREKQPQNITKHIRTPQKPHKQKMDSNDFPRVEVDSKGDILHLIKTFKHAAAEKVVSKCEKRNATDQQMEQAKQLVDEVFLAVLNANFAVD